MPKETLGRIQMAATDKLTMAEIIIIPEHSKVSPELAFPKGKKVDSPSVDWALFYADHGWPVFPVNPLNKKPYGGHGFYDATLDKNQIRQMWRQHPDGMIAKPTGLLSRTLVVDLDRKEGGADGVATWAKLTAEKGGAPVTLFSETPSTGQHHIFRHRYGLRCVPLNGIAPGVEIKADGGYIVLPPSLYTGPNRRRYVWQNNIALAEPPDWLVALIEEHNNHGPDPSESPAPRDQSVPIERVVAALSVIDPDIERKPWFNIGCALFAQLGDEQGFKLWNEWSSKAKEKYNEREMAGQWKSIVKKNYPYNIGTVFYHANEAQPDWDTTEQPKNDSPKILSIEIRPGQVETFKVSMEGGTVVVSAEELNDLRWFNRAAIAQLRRSFAPIKARDWSNEVDRALRAAREPVQLSEEQTRRHGTDTWRDDTRPLYLRAVQPCGNAETTNSGLHRPRTGRGRLAGSAWPVCNIVDRASAVFLAPCRRFRAIQWPEH